MANPIDYHAKLIIGDLVLTVARLTAELEAAREQVATLQAQLATPNKGEP
jgi:hypothetical protein